MTGPDGNPPPLPAGPHAIIAGFGIPGRFVAELLDFRSIPYCVIELNHATVARCKTAPFVIGDVREESVLRAAGIEKATLLALTVPVQEVVQEAIIIARRIRPDLKIFARVHYTSAGLKAQQLGADLVIVEEQLVAREFFRQIEGDLSGQRPTQT
jgi:CPA2 family monovalent cation:H+ antiporter-2